MLRGVYKAAYNLSNNFAGMRLVSKHHWIAYAQAKAGAYPRIPNPK